MSINKKVAFYTLGCKVNQYETEIIRKDFIENGYEEVKFEDKADVYVINTCTVTNIADKKNKKMLRRAKKTNPKSVVIATGCYAQTNVEDLKELTEVDYIIGNVNKEDIFKIYNKNLSNYQVSNIFDEKEYSSTKYTVLRDKARAFVKIQDGCTKFCSYCKIPYARGLSRSRKPVEVLEEIRFLGQAGYKEVVLTGINLSEYGLDLEEKMSFDDILENILEIEEVDRVRVSSVYPDTLSEKFIYLLKNNKKLMPHLHVSIQSLDDKVLSLMKRKYNAEFVVNLLRRVQNEVPELAMTADIIVGFPQEEDENFANTLENMKKIEFSDFHIFPYSDREKTAAGLLEGKIEPKVKKARVKILEELKNKKFKEFREKFLNTVQKIYIEEIKAGKAYGYTENYLKVEVDSTSSKITDIVEVKIFSITGDLLKGEII